MNRFTTLSAILVFSISAFTVEAQMKDMDTQKGMDMKGMEMKKDGGKAAQGTVHKGSGVVKKIDAAKGAVTLDHEPIKSVGWSAMTMTFIVKDKKMLENVKSGQKVQFEFVQEGKENVITSIK